MTNKKNSDLKEFLKLFTAVDEQFINEYYTFYEKCDGNNYGIILDDVIKYLDIKKKEKFFVNVKKRFTEDVDYIVSHVEGKKAQKGDKIVIYHINLDTFERICMRSNSVKANSVRDYFIIIRKFIQYYHKYFSTNIKKNMLLYPKEYVYILLVNKDKNIFKIGKTDDIRHRLQNYATGDDKHPDVKFIMRVNNKNAVETCVKTLIKRHQYKPNREIYRVDIDIIKNAIFDCGQMHSRYEEFKKIKNVDAYIIFDDDDIREKTLKQSKKQSKKSSKKQSKKSSKKYSKKQSKKQSKKRSKQNK